MIHFRVFFVVFILAGCSSLPSHFELATVENPIVYPAPPDIARIAYVGTIIGEANLVKSERAITTSQKIFKAIIGLPRYDDIKMNVLRPIAVTNWPGDSTFIVDAGNSSILKVDELNGEVKLITMANPDRKFVSPVSIAKIGDIAIAVADSAAGIVSVLDRNGNWIRDIGEGLLQRPVGIAVDPDTFDLYVADSKADNIKVFSSDGELIDVVGASGTGIGQFNGPTHLALKYPWLAVSDTLNARVQLIDIETEEIRIIGQRGLNVGNFVRPKGLAFDSEFNLYVLEGFYDYLLIYNVYGDYLMAMGGYGTEHGQFNLPSGLYINDRDTIYLTDLLNARVEVLQYLGGK